MCLNMEGFRLPLFSFVIIVLLVCSEGQSAGRNPCNSNENIPCDNGECIPRKSWCDKEIDCMDRSDEAHCQTKGWWGPDPDNHCTDRHFVCEDKSCIPGVARCDGVADCPDYSDEFEEICRKETTVESPSYGTRANLPTERPNIHDTVETFTPGPPATPRESGQHGRTPSPPTVTYDYNRQRGESNDRQRHGQHSPAPSGYGQNHYQDHYGQTAAPASHPHRGSDTAQGPHSQHSPTAPHSTNTYHGSSYGRTPAPDRTRYDSSRRSSNRHQVRLPPLMIPPRSVSFPTGQGPSYYSPETRIRHPALPHFRFSRNYTAELTYNYDRYIQKAKDWLLRQRDDSYGWGRDTPRGLIALSLITNSFTSGEADNELMQKSLQTHLGLMLLRNDTRAERMSTTRLAMYINALLATCQDPRDFLGRDLAAILYDRKRALEQDQKFVNPLVYLSLCLADKTIDEDEMHNLVLMLTPRFTNEVTKSFHILAMTALSCFLQKEPQNGQLRSIVHEGFQDLKSQKLGDESFGSIYLTALASQALMAVGSENPRDLKRTFDFLARNQSDDGSFGDMQATYYTLIALSGRNLLHLRNTHCESPVVDESTCPPPSLNAPGQTKSVFYSLRVGLPETFSTSLMLTVPIHTRDGAPTSFFDIMKAAACIDPRYKFNYKITKNLLGVHTIANLPSDMERGMFWNLYHLQQSDRSVDLQRRHTGDVRRLIPDNGDELLYWYLPVLGPRYP